MHMQLYRSSLILLTKAKAFAMSAHDTNAQQTVKSIIDKLPSASMGGAFTLGHSSLYLWGTDESAVLGMKRPAVALSRSMQSGDVPFLLQQWVSCTPSSCF
jgi:hypothetical protein